MAGTDWWPVSAGEVVVAGVPYPDESAQQGRGGGLLLVWFLDTCARDYFQQDKSAARRCGNLRIAGRSEESRQALYALRRTSLQRLAVWCFAGTSGGGENGRSSARDGCQHGASAGWWRYGANQGGRQRRVRDLYFQFLLCGAHAAFYRDRRPHADESHRHRLAQSEGLWRARQHRRRRRGEICAQQSRGGAVS